ncbi:hypothetical protein AB4Y67_18880 [Arthrobacter sp. YAF17]
MLEGMPDVGSRRGLFGHSAADAFAVGPTCGIGLEVRLELQETPWT